MNGIDRPQLRQQLNRLDDPELDALCLDHFPEVYDKFSRGLRRDEKVTLILDHCRRNSAELARLIGLLGGDGRPQETGLPALSCEDAPVTINPFCDRGRIQDPQRFFGRKRLVRELGTMLAAGNCVALVGPPEIGKSSLLYYLYANRANWQGGFTTLYLDLQRVLDEGDFCEEVLRMLGEPTGDLRVLKRVLCGRRIVLLLDEVEKLGDTGFSPRLHDLLRALAQEENFKLAVAAHRPLAQVFPPSEATSPFHNIFTERRIGPFSPEETHEFMKMRLQGTGVTFMPAEIEFLAIESGGHPAKLQRLAGELFDRKQGG